MHCFSYSTCFLFAFPPCFHHIYLHSLTSQRHYLHYTTGHHHCITSSLVALSSTLDVLRFPYHHIYQHHFWATFPNYCNMSKFVRTKSFSNVILVKLDRQTHTPVKGVARDNRAWPSNGKELISYNIIFTYPRGKVFQSHRRWHAIKIEIIK